MKTFHQSIIGNLFENFSIVLKNTILRDLRTEKKLGVEYDGNGKEFVG